jgi:hypothetical protein
MHSVPLVQAYRSCLLITALLYPVVVPVVMLRSLHTTPCMPNITWRWWSPLRWNHLMLLFLACYRSRCTSETSAVCATRCTTLSSSSPNPNSLCKVGGLSSPVGALACSTRYFLTRVFFFGCWSCQVPRVVPFGYLGHVGGAFISLSNSYLAKVLPDRGYLCCAVILNSIFS